MKSGNDLVLLKRYLSSIDMENVETKSLGNYKSAVLVCLDATLSINRKYYTFVVPRITYFQNKYPNILKLDELVELINTVGVQNFSECWNYNHPERVRILHDLCNRLIEISNLYEGDNELISLRKWANDTRVLDYDKFGVKGIGFATYQYIRMLLGANTVKPDVHIKNKISEIVGRKVNDKYAVQLFESACGDLKLNIADVEHYIWNENANNSEEFNMVWEDNRWVES